ncbi:methyltransferase [Aeromicrobium sp. UC242_57]|uniref:methyltransferase n=1 Tax=Aeromicrobium sp. UC242_57 TaxID=3374624 RepID=UPI0037AEF0A2
MRSEQWFEDTYLDSIASFAPYIAAPLVESGVLDETDHIVLHSDGAAAIAQALVARNADAHITIVALPSHAAWLNRELKTSIPDENARKRVSVAEQSMFESPPDCDAVLFVKSLSQLPDADAVHVLQKTSNSLTSGDRLLVLEDVFDVDGLDEHAAEADVLNLALHGSGHRTDAELRALFERAGLRLDEVQTIGWGHSLYLLRTSEKGITC